MPIQNKTISKLIYSVLGAFLIIGFGFIIILFTPLYSTFEEPDSEVTIYYVDNISRAHQIIIDDFNKTYKGRIFVETINLPFSKFTTNERKQLLTRYLRNESDKIDIISIDQIWVPRFSKWCEPLGQYLSEDIRNSILPEALSACYYEDKLVALPMFIDIGLLYYRADLIKTLPQSTKWEEKILRSLTWKDLHTLKKYFPQNDIYIFQAAPYEGLMCNFFELYYPTSDTRELVSPTEIANEHTGSVITILRKYINEWNISPKEVITFKENESFTYFLEHDALFLRGWPNTGWNYYDEQKYQEKLNHIKKAPLPHFDNKKPAYALGGWNLMLTRFSKHKPEALTFIKYFLTEKAQKTLFIEGGYTPVNLDVYNDTSFTDRYPDLDLYKSLFPHGVIRPKFSYYTKLSDIVSEHINNALENHLSVKKILYQVKQAIESSIINQNFEFYYDSLQTIQ